MTLLDRFRAQLQDKHLDPAVRLALVESLPLDDIAAIRAAAREDDDPRVRRAAVSKLMLPAELAAIAKDDGDETVRAQAVAMLRDLALEVFEEAGEAEGLMALAAIDDPRALVQVARQALRPSVAHQAIARITDGRMLGSVARHAALDLARRSALDLLFSRNDRSEILAVAMNSDFKDTALAALESLTDRADLEQVMVRGKNKSAVKRARSLAREADDRAEQDLAAARAAKAAETAAADAAMLASAAVPDPESASATPPHGDPLAAQVDVVDPAAEEARRLEAEALAHAAALADAEAAAQTLARRHDRLAALVEEAAAAAILEPLPAARKQFGALAREWRGLVAGITADGLLLDRFAALEAAMGSRDAEAREADERARREALVRVTTLLHRVEPLVPQADLTLKAADRGLRDVRTLLGTMPPLPSKQDFEDVSRRLKAAQVGLAAKVQELREADDWKRFANAAVQEQLCARMEALRTVEDIEAVASTVRDLQRQWRDAADVPRAQADALWRRFKQAHDEVWARCEAHFAAQAIARAENLTRKTVLCEQAESLAESTNWIQAAEAIKKLQAEWKTIGPVSRGKERAIWERFRTACDRFFTRRQEDLVARKAVWAENLARKDALCVRAEALAGSTDWDAAAAELRKLQAEWKTIGPVKKTRAEAVWQRFRGACDAFFARYAQRHDVARAERIAAREQICADLEAVASGSEPPSGLVVVLRELRGRWQQDAQARAADPGRAKALEQRFETAFRSVVARWPDALAGTELDTSENRKRMEALVRRVEALVTSVAGAAQAEEALSPTSRLAAMLKEALAANTIGGKADEDGRARALAEELRQAQAAWARLGPVEEEARRALSDRFQRAVRSLTERTEKGRTTR